MRITFLKKTGSYHKNGTYEINDRLAKVLIHTRQAIVEVVQVPEVKQVVQAPENRMMTPVEPIAKKRPGRKPAAPKTTVASKNEYETKAVSASK